MSDATAVNPVAPDAAPSQRSLPRVLLSHWILFISILGGLLLLCLLYCLIATPQYEARAQVTLNVFQTSSLTLDTSDTPRTGSSLATREIEFETLANVFRSDQLAWRVILDQKLYQAPGFQRAFAARFPDFRPESPSPEAQTWLLEHFQRALSVRTIPRTVLLEIRFRSPDPRLSTAVVNSLIRTLQQQESEAIIGTTAQATRWLQDQLKDLKTRADRDDRALADFQKEHGLLIAPGRLANGMPGSSEHLSAVLEVDELGRELVAASADRIVLEAEFRAASTGDPELVLASDPRLQNESGGISVAAFRQIHQQRSDLEQERARLAAEHGPNFPRVVEIRQQIDDLDHQLQSEDAKLLERFRSAFQTAADREQMLRKALADSTGQGQDQSAAATQYETMRREADASHELYIRMQAKAEEADMTAGAVGADFWVVDPPHIPAKPAAPNLPLYMAITLFVGFWLAAATVLLVDLLHSWRLRSVAAILILAACAGLAHSQAPTPNTSGLPTGVVKLPPAPDTRVTPNPKEAPPVWNTSASAVPLDSPALEAAVPGPIQPLETLDVTEYHTPEFHSVVRVSVSGTVILPMIGEIKVAGLDEQAAAAAIAAALLDKGMLLHPQVTVLVTSFVGQDVTILGEVARPGVYPYGVHHSLLDLISAASGLSPSAGGLVNIIHRDNPSNPQMVTLDFGQSSNPAQNPDLRPGDTVQVSRAGLVYVIGAVNRPGGFTLDPTHSTTALQAISLAWGPSQTASLPHAMLIHAGDDGRTVTTLNLKRMLRGQDPDIPVSEHDILFVPDSTARAVWNRTLESVVQSAAGVSLYAGMVYSQRF